MPLAGALYAALAYGTWGVLPIYWKALGGVPLQIGRASCRERVCQYV